MSGSPAQRRIDAALADLQCVVSAFFERIGILTTQKKLFMQRLNCVCKAAKLRPLTAGKRLSRLDTEMQHYIVHCLAVVRNSAGRGEMRNTSDTSEHAAASSKGVLRRRDAVAQPLHQTGQEGVCAATQGCRGRRADHGRDRGGS